MTGETSRFPETYFWLIVQILTIEASLKNNLNVILHTLKCSTLDYSMTMQERQSALARGREDETCHSNWGLC